MSLKYQVVTQTIKGLTHLLCQVDAGQLSKVPTHGPLLVICNHINFIEVPLLYTHLLPRPVTGFAKSETWDNYWMAALFNLWGAIPLRRDEADVAALRQGLSALEQGKILVITPEGTRSGHGRLQKGRPGVVTLAALSGAPVLPLVYWGGEEIYTNMRRLRRTPFHIRVGDPFRVTIPGSRVTREVRQDVTDEMMYRLAALLPPNYRGEYANPPDKFFYLL